MLVNLPHLIAAVLLLVIPHDPVLADRVDLIEVNHFHDCDQAKFVFSQLCLWEWSEDHFRVVDYRLLHKASCPRFDYSTGEHIAAWHENGRLREVRAHQRFWKHGLSRIPSWPTVRSGRSGIGGNYP